MIKLVHEKYERTNIATRLLSLAMLESKTKQESLKKVKEGTQDSNS